MGDFIISEGKNTPTVKFTAQSCTLSITGKSYPENARKFYDEVYSRLDLKGIKEFTVVMDFDYVSSSSVICMLEVLKKLKTNSGSTNFIVRFFYEKGDDDMLAVGENYEKITGIKFEYLVK
ncbi:MAG TPA: SiaC family regulatory phosphoprotein [Flavobacteriales bacterium]|nr:SiaC family regulatory phosphoprotein [Flavobacteriales bacterium]